MFPIWFGLRCCVRIGVLKRLFYDVFYVSLAVYRAGCFRGSRLRGVGNDPASGSLSPAGLSVGVYLAVLQAPRRRRQSESHACFPSSALCFSIFSSCLSQPSFLYAFFVYFLLFLLFSMFFSLSFLPPVFLFFPFYVTFSFSVSYFSLCAFLLSALLPLFGSCI